LGKISQRKFRVASLQAVQLIYAFVFRRIMDFDQMMPVAVAMAEAGHAIRIGVMGNQLNINNDPRLSLLPEQPKIWQLNQPLTRLKCRLFMRGISCLVMDWARRGHGVTELLTDIARENSIPSVALPHGIDIVTDMSYYEEAMDATTFAHFDHIVAPNRLRQTVLTDAGLPLERIHILGSARFTKSWSDRLSSAYPARPVRDPNKLKVVHFDGLAPKHQASTTPTLRQVSKLPFLDLAIQPKPSQSANLEETLEGIFPELIDRNNASQLCRWADVAMFAGSSVALEMLIRGGELIWLKYLDSEPMAVENYSACRVVNSASELLDLLTKLKNGDAGPCPDSSAFIRDFLQGDHNNPNVVERYVEFLNSRIVTSPRVGA
jgi:hypothetical protein